MDSPLPPAVGGRGVRGPDVGPARAFTRLELVVVLACLGVLTLVMWPAMAGQRERSLRVLCGDNLRLIGQAYAQWGAEHGGRVPSRTVWWEGGTAPYSMTAPWGASAPSWFGTRLYTNAWFQFLSLSNELRSPRILACPSDVEKSPAANWSGEHEGSLMNANHRGHAVSYLVSVDVLPSMPLALLSGDRNLRSSRIINACSSGIGNVSSLDLNPPADRFGITNGLHVGQGNLLFTDGRVEELSSDQFYRRILEVYSFQPLGGVHYIAH